MSTKKKTAVTRMQQKRRGSLLGAVGAVRVLLSAPVTVGPRLEWALWTTALVLLFALGSWVELR